MRSDKMNITRFDLQRRVVSTATSRSWREVPHVSFIYEPDITDFYGEFEKLKLQKKASGQKITFNTLMIKVIVQGLKAAPVLNSHVNFSFKKAEGHIKNNPRINVAVPWLLDDGRMITPTLFNAGSMSIDEISQAIAVIGKKIGNTNIDELLYQTAFSDALHDLKRLKLSVISRIIATQITFHPLKRLPKKEREQYYKIPENERLTANDLLDATVTVSNLGSLYKEQRGHIALLEIIPPQVFVAGIGSVQEKPAVFENNGTKEIGVRKVLPICLAFDHRAFDFNALIPFLKTLDGIFEETQVIHEW